MSNLTGLTDTVSYYCSLQGVKKKTTKIFNFPLQSGRRGGLMVSALVSGRAVRVQALVGDIVLCSWARHFTLTVPLSTQVNKWVPANLMLGVTLRWTSIPSRG